VIIGAGLGGCFLASRLLEYFEITMIELAEEPPLLRDRLVDVSQPAITYPNIESGLGGTTKAWHNALMEIDATIFDQKWPFSKEILASYYDQAYVALSGTTRDNILQFSESLKSDLKKMGFSELLLKQNMFIPKNRINAWKSLNLKGKVKIIEGEVTELISDGIKRICKANVSGKGGKHLVVEADYFILSAGGLGSPLLLQKLFKSLPLPGLKHAGFHYEDHPMAFVGEVELNKPLYKLWNFPVKTLTGNANIRFPLTIKIKDLNISFQLRPAHHFRLSKPRTKVNSVITDLRNFPFKFKNYWQLLTHIDDILEILSFKFGLRIPTRNYTILMVAEQPPTPYCAIWKKDGNISIFRKWEIDATFVNLVNESVGKFLDMIRPISKKSHLFSQWSENVYSSSHHSGTAKLSKNQEEGVCDLNGQVHGISNLFVCDGSIIPSSGFVNTGLTIVALAMRMADFLSELVVTKSKVN